MHADSHKQAQDREGGVNADESWGTEGRDYSEGYAGGHTSDGGEVAPLLSALRPGSEHMAGVELAGQREPLHRRVVVHDGGHLQGVTVVVFLGRCGLHGPRVSVGGFLRGVG